MQSVGSHQHAVCTTIHNTAMGHSFLNDSHTEDILLPQTLLHKPVMVIKIKRTHHCSHQSNRAEERSALVKLHNTTANE